MTKASWRRSEAMKLKPLERELSPAELNLQIPGKLAEVLGDYGRYFEAQHAQTIAQDVLIAQILSAFVASDHDFQKWRRERSGRAIRKGSKVPRGANPTSESS
jgi:hypothetical protein